MRWEKRSATTLSFWLPSSIEVRVVEEMQCLGVRLDGKASTAAMLRGREEAADAQWHLHSGLLPLPSVHEDEHTKVKSLYLLYSTLAQSAENGAPLWKLDTATPECHSAARAA